MLRFRQTFLAALCLGCLGTAVWGGTITINGTCELGNCASPGILASGGSTGSGFDFLFIFGNTDRFDVNGSFNATNTSGPQLDVTGLSVTFLGNGFGTDSGTDTLTIDISQSFASGITSGHAFETLGGDFGGPIATGSSAAAELFIGPDALPVMGPFFSPDPFSTSFSNVAVSGLGNPLALDLRFTDTFASGSGVGAAINQDTPEPSTLLLLLTGVAGLMFLQRRQSSIHRHGVAKLALLLTVAGGIASAQPPRIPESQQRFCAVLDNWQFRGGYPPGAVPKVDPNPIKAAQAPKPPSPGDLFDQLVEVFGTAGTFTNWKGKVEFFITDQAVRVSLLPFCPEPAKAGRQTWLILETQSAQALPLRSPFAQFLASAKQDDMVTLSGHLFYLPQIRFFLEGAMVPGGPRKRGSEQFFALANSLVMEVSGITK